MTKSDLIDVLCETRKVAKGRAEELVNMIFDSMEAALKRGERIEIRGFGSFEIRSYRSYEGRNPRTGVTVKVKPKRLPFFKVGKELKERVNEARLRASIVRAAAKRAPDVEIESEAMPEPMSAAPAATVPETGTTEPKPAGRSRATA
jgi:integration host factor subunit beta